MKRLSLLFLAAIFTLSSFGQVFSLGAKVGYNTSLGFDQNWNYDASSVSFKNDISNGFHVGLYARIGRRFYVQPEVLYNYSVYKQSLDLGIAKISTKKIKSSTIDVPVLAGFSIVNAKSFKLRIMVGPKFSFNAGSTRLDDWSDVEAKARTTRVGLDTGIGIDVWRLNLDVRYNLMGNLYSFEDSTSDTKLNTKPNNIFVVSLGFRIFGNNGKN